MPIRGINDRRAKPDNDGKEAPKAKKQGGAPTRKQKQKAKKRLAEARETAQRLGVTPPGPIMAEAVVAASTELTKQVEALATSLKVQWRDLDAVKAAAVGRIMGVLSDDEAGHFFTLMAVGKVIEMNAQEMTQQKLNAGLRDGNGVQVNLGMQFHDTPNHEASNSNPRSGYTGDEAIRKFNDLAQAVGVEPSGEVLGSREVTNGEGDNPRFLLVEPDEGDGTSGLAG